jgi:glutathione-regulated potassium-efflux system ancillary protein KefC
LEAVVVAIAYGLGLLAARLALPPLVGYLAAGLALSLLGIESTPLLERIASVGVLLLLFTIGLTLNLGGLFRPQVAGVGGLHLLLAVPLLGVVLWWVGVSPDPVVLLLLAVALANPSTVLLGKILEQKRELLSFHGRLAVGISVFQDLASLGLLVLVGVQDPSPWALLLFGLPLLRPAVGWVLDHSRQDELVLLFGLALALGGAELAGRIGLAPELGALFIGAALARHPKVEELSQMLWSLRESFLVAFFVKVGLGGIPGPGSLLLGLGLVALLPLKAMLLFVLLLRFGLRARTGFLATAGLATYSEFTLVAAAIAQERGLLEAEWGGVLAVAVALSIALAAPLNWAAHPLYQRLERALLRFEARDRHPDTEPTRLEGATWLIAGMGRTGGAAYRYLTEKGERVLGLDSDPEKIQLHQARGRRVVYGDAEDPELWENLDLGPLKGILLTMPELEAKLQALRHIRRKGYKGLVAATTFHWEEDPLIEQAGASLIFRPFAEAGERLAERVLEAVALAANTPAGRAEEQPETTETTETARDVQA